MHVTGATVITTTRWPKDAALRYSHEHDWSTWRHRLTIEALELADIHAVEQFCDRLTQKLTPMASSSCSDGGGGSQDAAPGRDREGEGVGVGAGVGGSAFGGAVLGPRLHVLINNAAQTITRPVGWKDKMARLDVDTHALLRDEARGMIADAPHTAPVSGRTTAVPTVNNPFTGKGICELARAPSADEPSTSVPPPEGKEPPHGERNDKVLGAGKQENQSEAGRQQQKESKEEVEEEVVMVVSGANRKSRAKDGSWITLDESGQPLDLSGVNSWSRRLGDVGTQELCETFAVNAIAPFLLCSRLKGVLAPRSGAATTGGCDGQPGAAAQGQGGEKCSAGDETRQNSDEGETRAGGAEGAGNDRSADVVAGGVGPASREDLLRASGHIVNVTALEGKFNVGKKSTGHPHTNMAKAALNMLTLTSARDLAHSGIYMSSVDTGWWAVTYLPFFTHSHRPSLPVAFMLTCSLSLCLFVLSFSSYKQ